jgi:glycosyltransferase involved in cell wall biosynthesis
MNEYPGISVIIPTFNREKFLAEAISSILLQNYRGKVEIIVSDDGSTDNSLKIAAGFGNKIKIITKPSDCFSQGAAGARNRGITVASQPFICFLDSDDFYLEGHFNNIIKPFLENPAIGFVFCRVLECREKNGIKLFRQWTNPMISKRDIKHPVVSRSHIVHTISFMFKKEVFEKAGLFNENYSNGEDGDLWMRISELFKGSFSDHFGGVYRAIHEDQQLTKNQNKKINKDSILIFKAAIERYHQLKLKDTFRIFKLEQKLLDEMYMKRTRNYYYKYIRLILHYPFSVLYIIQDYHHAYNNKKRPNNFKAVNYFSSN